jgi:hypothetical protein
MIGLNTRDLKQAPTVYTGAFSYWKAITLAVIATALAFASSYLTNEVIHSLPSTNIHMFAWGVVAVIFFLVMLVLEVMFINLKNYLLAALILNGVALGSGLIPTFDQKALIASIVATVLIVSAGYYAKDVIDDSLKIRFFHIANIILKGGIVAIAVIAALLFFNVFSSKPIDSNNPILPQSVFDSSAGFFSKTLGSALGGIDFSLTLRQVSTLALDKQIAQDPALSGQITPAIREQIINKAVEDYQTRIIGFIGSKINPDEKLSSAIYGAMLLKINALPEATRSLVLLGGAVVLLFTVAAISPFIRPIIALIAYVFYEILLAVGFGSVVFENRSKETIVLS